MKPPKLQVNLKNIQRKWPINRQQICRYLEKSWTKLPTAKTRIPAELTVVFVNDRKIREYNKRYRHKDYPTDVLSFPVQEMHDHLYYVGDILISMERSAVQAAEKGHSMQREMKILLLHGVLHLLGYDHETDRGQMERLERKLRKILL